MPVPDNWQARFNLEMPVLRTEFSSLYTAVIERSTHSVIFLAEKAYIYPDSARRPLRGSISSEKWTLNRLESAFQYYNARGHLNVASNQ
jgi:hypothetical protein